MKFDDDIRVKMFRILRGDLRKDGVPDDAAMLATAAVERNWESLVDQVNPGASGGKAELLREIKGISDDVTSLDDEVSSDLDALSKKLKALSDGVKHLASQPAVLRPPEVDPGWIVALVPVRGVFLQVACEAVTGEIRFWSDAESQWVTAQPQGKVDRLPEP
jgi:hypothetical protein